jgi:hypothetical protein
MPSASVSDRKNLEEFDSEQYRVRADRLVVRRLSEDEDDDILSAIARVLVKIIADAHARRRKHEDEKQVGDRKFQLSAIGDWLFHSP